MKRVMITTENGKTCKPSEVIWLPETDDALCLTCFCPAIVPSRPHYTNDMDDELAITHRNTGICIVMLEPVNGKKKETWIKFGTRLVKAFWKLFSDYEHVILIKSSDEKEIGKTIGVNRGHWLLVCAKLGVVKKYDPKIDYRDM